tara:strand:+ start:1117 stop:1566 length:450 start_codon:yes stop_codon:yes gene_type:complete
MNKLLNNKKILFSIPLIIIGLTMVIMGTQWMISKEPWMLDKLANEERLEMSFDELFKSPINDTLPGYLKQIYRFFGLWVIIIGLFILSFSRSNIIEYQKVRFSLIFCVGIMVYLGLILAYILIPSSPFIYLGWFSILMHFISLWNYKKF